MHHEFARESEMSIPATGWLAARRLMVKAEFVSPWGICDLVGARLKRSNVAHRLDYRQTNRIASITRAALLFKVPDIETGESITLGRLVRDCSPAVPEGELTNELHQLERDGFVKRGRRGQLQKLNGWVPLQEEIVALELKLSRVEEAVHQARNNLGFADLSFVGLPSLVACRIAESRVRRREFTREGIGLLSVGETRCRVVIRPRRRAEWTDKALQLYCVDKFWRDHLSQPSHRQLSINGSATASGRLAVPLSGKSGRVLPRAYAAERS